MERLPDPPAEPAELLTDAQLLEAAQALISAGADMHRLEFLRRLGRQALEYDVATPPSSEPMQLPPPEPA